MRKASDIVLLVGGILEILATLTFAALALVFMILSSPASAEIIKEGLQNGTITTSFAGSVDEQVAVIQLAFKAMGVVFVVLTVFSLIGCVVSFLAKAKKTNPLYVLAIVFGAVSIEVPLIGGIFGLIANKRGE